MQKNKFKSMSWEIIWSSREIDKVGDNLANDSVLHENLLLLDGFDSPTGSILVSSWVSFIGKLIAELSINSSHSIYEVG
jgi:hypothetical protein